jgi:coatomer subunit beta'
LPYFHQPLRLDIKKKLSASSERVKSVDIHPSEPWVLAALYSGNVMIWDYESGGCVKSFELSELPVRCAKFISRRQWFIAASDDMRLRVFNYNTMEKVKEFEAHADYIRSLEVHPTLPYVLSSSDDMTIKLWDWDRGFDCTQVFEGHAHYVMQVKFNPKDTNTFASASLDRTIKVWGLGSHTPHYTLEGHEKGVNCVDYYPSGDKPYILSGADDRTVKIWDYQVKTSHETRPFDAYHTNTHYILVLIDQIDCSLSRGTHAQCLCRNVPSKASYYCFGFRRWHCSHLAVYHLSL